MHTYKYFVYIGLLLTHMCAMLFHLPPFKIDKERFVKTSEVQNIIRAK